MLPLRQAARDRDFAYQPSTDKRQVLTLASRHPAGHCDDWIVLRPLRVGKMHLAVLLPVDAACPVIGCSSRRPHSSLLH
ncbi:hypothetical protein AZKH_p0422 (plasmid) [Azoarcus sp. KH32C]|nr:hypothetical protein AZKH_p0422 [Azoarcus sp. KH32C]